MEWLETIRPLLAGLAGGAGVWLLARLAARPAAERQGWRAVRPSAMHWTGFILGSGLVCLFAYVRLFVGSTRADAASQMQVLSWLIAAFTIGITVCAIQMARIARARVEWRGSQIAFTGPDGERLVRPMHEIAAMHRRWTGTIEVAFVDGAAFQLDEHASGAAELCERIIAVGELSDPAR